MGAVTVVCVPDAESGGVAAGYVRVERCASPEDLADCLRGAADGPLFVHAPILPGTPRDLPRPHVRPDEVAARLRACLEDA